jgi:hypothetical protein
LHLLAPRGARFRHACEEAFSYWSVRALKSMRVAQALAQDGGDRRPIRSSAAAWMIVHFRTLYLILI